MIDLELAIACMAIVALLAFIAWQQRVIETQSARIKDYERATKHYAAFIFEQQDKHEKFCDELAAHWENGYRDLVKMAGKKWDKNKVE